jgi:signal transduction histidine kinase/CheY-like chemotaxis protein/ligand-binding sensor domain-containing protein
VFFTILQLLIVLSVFTEGLAQTSPNSEKFIPAISYTMKKGLLSNDIQDIIQDKQGFLWIATTHGLNRFDSKSFDDFVYDKSKADSIPDNYIENLKLMPNGEIWLSILETGISIFNTKNNLAQSIKNSDSPLFKLPNNNLFGMAIDKNNNIWFSLYGEGIYQWDGKLKRFHKHLSTDDHAWLTSKQTFEIFIDSHNRLWVCTIDSKVFLYDIDTGKSQEFDFAKNSDDPLTNPIYGFAESSNGMILAGGYSGVYQYNEKEKKFDVLVSEQQIAQVYNGERTSVRRLLMDSNDNLWIGTVTSLLQLSNDKLFKVRLYEDGEVFDKLGWTVHSIIETSDGNIWIGTEGIGMLKIPSDWNRYNTYISSEKEPKDIRRAFLHQDKLWIAHPSSKLDQIYLNGDSLSLIKTIKPYLGANLIRIDTIFQDSDEYLWLSSIKGIHQINTSTGESTKVASPLDKELGNTKHLYKSKNNKFYFSLFSEEIGYFNQSDMQAHLIKNTPQNHIKGTLVSQISDGVGNKLWLATDYGIESLDLDSNIYDVIYTVEKGETISSFNLELSTGIVWAINDGNLIQLKWNGNKLIKLNNDYMKPISTIKLEEIEKFGNNLYISTYDSGVIILNTKTLEITNYTQDNGLPSNDIVKTFFLHGRLIIVTVSGVVMENLDFQEPPELNFDIVIDKVSLGNKPLLEDERKNLVLDYSYGSINIDVALLSYSDSSTFEYQYRLKGATNDWINVNGDDKFAFLNLKGGSYNFQVKGRSNYGKWSKIAEFPFVVKAAPWKTLWAYGLYVISALLILSWLLYLYKRKILYEHEISKKQAQKDLADAASKAKSDFLARVSHEVRTPLNGVLGMSELLLDTQVDEEQKIYADTIHTSGKHLLDIINDILDLSKIEAGKLELEELPFDLLLLVDEVCSSFISQCRLKQLLFSCVFDHKTPRNRIGDVIRLKQILFNLLSNAFKFTKEGEVTIKISSAKDSNNVVISVQDTGIGIDEKLVQSLFEPFVQADSAITRKFGGTGLGLAICKQLTEKMNGAIDVSSKINSGTTFTINIPLKFDEKPVVFDSKQTTQSNICLLLEESHVRQSIVEYCQLLSISYSDQINNKTKCVFIDQNFIAKGQFNKVLGVAKNQKTKIIAISFDEHTYPEHLNDLNIPLITSPPPLTFKKMQELCLDEFSVDQSNLNPMKIIKHQRVLKLLVVEDSAINQQVSIEMLEKMGHMVDVVDNAEEGLTMLQRNNYDMLFLDYHLPGMDGFQLVQQWNNSQKIPVVMVTADLTDDVLIKAQKYQMTEVVAKPFSQQTLSNIIQKTMGFD